MISFVISQESNLTFDTVLHRLREEVEKGVIDPVIGTLPKQCQLLCEQLIDMTPPLNQAQGKKRTEKDIRHIFNPKSADDFDDPSIKRMIKKGDAVAWAKFSSNVRSGALQNTKPVEPTQALHNAFRYTSGNKAGRAKRGKSGMVTLKPQQKTLRLLIADSKAKVGLAKSGWLKGYLATGGTRAPAWVTRHGTDSGTFVDGVTGQANSEKWFYEVNNNTAWAGRPNAQGFVKKALELRAAAMQKYLNTMMRLAAEKSGHG